jgi:hypothetical protein
MAPAAKVGPIPNTSNQAAYRTLSLVSKDTAREPAAAPGSAPPATLAGGGKPGLKVPPLSPRLRQEMVGDIETIVAIMKTQYVTEAEERQINGIVAKYSALDRDLRPPLGETLSPNLDHFLILMKSRSFARSSIKSLGQDQYAILYDAIWYRFGDEALDEFRNLVARSQTQKTSGPSDKDVENGAALIAQQEAMGMWGMLKGMGTGLVGIAGPKAQQWIGEYFDETAHILFGEKWDSSEPLVWGMNAGQIGTVGGDVIMQLVQLQRAAGSSPAGLAKANKLRTLIEKIQKAIAIGETTKKVIGVGTAAQGILLAAAGIADIIQQRKDANKPIDATLFEDPNFLDQLVVLVTSAIGAVMAARGHASKSQAITAARLQLLMKGLNLATAIARVSEIAASDRSREEKERDYGNVIASVIPQLVAAAGDVHGYAKAKQAPDDASTSVKAPAKKDESSEDAAAKAEPLKDAQEEAVPLTDAALKTPPVEDAAVTPIAKVPGADEVPAPTTPVPHAEPDDQAAALKATPQPQADEESGDLARKSMADAAQPVKRPQKYYPESAAGEQLQAQLHAEAQTGLAPRQAPQTPEEVASGARKAKYAPVKTESTTIQKSIATLDEARATYDDVIAETGGKYEVGIYQTPDGKYAVRLGQVANVDAHSDWRSVQHYHTNEPDIPLWRMPARADITEPFVRAERTNKPTTEIVEYPLPGGKRGRAAYTVNPDGSMKVEFVDVAGKKVVKPFASIQDYNEYYETQTIHVDLNSETGKRLLAGPGAPKADADPNMSTKTQYGPAPDEKAPAPKKPLATIGQAEADKNKALKPSGDPFKDLGDEQRKDPRDIKQKPSDEGPLVAVRIGDKTNEKGQYWVEGSDEFEGAHAGKGKDRTVRPEFVVMPEKRAKELTFRPAGTPFDPSIVPRKQGNQQLESTGAGRRLKQDDEGNERGHRVTGRANKSPDDDPSANTFVRTVGADVAQAHGYNHLLSGGELGILRPGNISRGGVDAITAKVVNGKAQIFLNDFTDVDTSKPSNKDKQARWFKELQTAVADNRLDFGDPATNAAVVKAIKDGEVYVRTVRIDTAPHKTPDKMLPVTVGTPEKLDPQ